MAHAAFATACERAANRVRLPRRLLAHAVSSRRGGAADQLAAVADQQQAGPYTWDELAAVYRSRWDIEVFFKFIKHHLNYSRLTSRSENGIKVMIYMNLIAALLLIWYKEQTGIDRGWRSVKFWLADDVRRWTQELMQTVRFADDE